MKSLPSTAEFRPFAQYLLDCGVISKIELPTRSQIFYHFATIDAHVSYFLPEGRLQFLLQFEFDFKARERSLLLVVFGNKLTYAGIVDCLLDSWQAVTILDVFIAAIAHEGVDGFVILVVDCNNQRSVAPSIGLVDICTS